MELHELHVADFRAGAHRNSHTIPGCPVGVGRIAIDLPKPAGGQQHSGAADLLRNSILVENGNGADTAVLGCESRHKSERGNRDRLEGLCLFPYCAQDFPASGISLGVQQAGFAVGVFQSEGQLGSMVLAPGDQFVDALGSFLQQHLHRSDVAEAIAGIERVLQVEADLIFVAEPGGLAFRILRFEAGEILFRQQEHTSGLCQVDGGTQSGNARANDYKVGLGWKTFHKPQK
jgi:hypothetical protein